MVRKWEGRAREASARERKGLGFLNGLAFKGIGD